MFIKNSIKRLMLFILVQVSFVLCFVYFFKFRNFGVSAHNLKQNMYSLFLDQCGSKNNENSNEDNLNQSYNKFLRDIAFSNFVFSNDFSEKFSKIFKNSFENSKHYNHYLGDDPLSRSLRLENNFAVYMLFDAVDSDFLKKLSYGEQSELSDITNSNGLTDPQKKLLVEELLLLQIICFKYYIIHIKKIENEMKLYEKLKAMLETVAWYRQDLIEMQQRLFGLDSYFYKLVCTKFCDEKIFERFKKIFFLLTEVMKEFDEYNRKNYLLWKEQKQQK